jgi:hypothetical protein
VTEVRTSFSASELSAAAMISDGLGETGGCMVGETVVENEAVETG